MREHKYRAWNTVKKVMYSAEELGADQETLSPDGRGFVNVSSDSTRLSEYHTHLLPLQYTGLKDKNGKEIYEGDIVQFKYANFKKLVVAPIKWGGCGFWIVGYLHDLGWREIEVIGNIYENLELLEGGKL